MSDLVRRLSEGRHPVIASVKPERTVKTLSGCLDRGYVHIKFTGTRGGTELGIAIDRSQSDFTSADFANETGQMRIVGALSLDYVKVRCVAEIALPSLEGHGWLEPLTD